MEVTVFETLTETNNGIRPCPADTLFTGTQRSANEYYFLDGPLILMKEFYRKVFKLKKITIT